MVWKIEKWLSDVFPGKSNIYSEYGHLKPRELVIVSAAVLDVALAELLSLRLISHKNEIEKFLGLDGDGRAPVGTFSSRIQLALLTGIITKSDVEILKIIKKLRNIFAHRVNTGFLSPEVLKETKKLHKLWLKQSEDITKNQKINTDLEPLKNLTKYLPKYSEAGEGLLISIFAVYQAYFHKLHSMINQIDLIITE